MLGAGLGASLALPARAQCRPQPLATTRLRTVEGFAVLSATIAGTPVSFLLDTGAEAHLILPAADAVLRLPRLPGTVPLIGIGGASQAPLVQLDHVRLGAARLDPAPAPVAPLPALPEVAPLLAGLLGAPLLHQFDLELDAQAGRLGVFPPGTCPPGANTIPLDRTPDGRLLLPVRIDGVPLTALLDTGSRATVLTTETARRLGLHAPISANTARGVDGERLPIAHLRVRNFAVGTDLRHDAPVSIAPLLLARADLLLGFDYLRQRRVWISALRARLTIA